MIPRRILILDDDITCREMLALFLRREGHEVGCCASGSEAVEHARVARPDVVVTDWRLQGGPEEALEALRALHEECPRTVLLVMTGSPADEVRARLDGLPVALVLRKPLDLARLAERLAEVAVGDQ